MTGRPARLAYRPRYPRTRIIIIKYAFIIRGGEGEGGGGEEEKEDTKRKCIYLSRQKEQQRQHLQENIYDRRRASRHSNNNIIIIGVGIDLRGRYAHFIMRLMCPPYKSVRRATNFRSRVLLVLKLD